MKVVEILVLLALVAAVGAVAAGYIRGGLPEPTATVPDPGLPSGEVGPDDVGRVRFSLAFRGYRMDQVDETLDRLTTELAERDAEIARLKGE